MPLPNDSIISPPTATGTRSRLPFTLSVVMLAIYFIFIYLVAFQSTAMGQTIVPGLSWGILLGAVVIFSSWFLTLIYVMSFKKTEGGR